MIEIPSTFANQLLHDIFFKILASNRVLTELSPKGKVFP